jgi:hypothetical protein
MRISSWSKGVGAALLVLCLSLGIWKARAAVQAARQEAAVAWAALAGDSVTLAATKAERDQYQTLFEQAKRVNGKPVAGVKLVVPHTDTLWRHDTLPTELLPDSTRRAEFTDSAADGTSVHVAVVAKPCCAPLEANVQLTVPADTLTVGFIQVGSRTVVTAQSRTRKVEVDAPFLVPPSLPRWGRFVEVLGDPHTVTLRGGVTLRTFGGVDLEAVTDKRFTSQDAARWLVGVRYHF